MCEVVVVVFKVCECLLQMKIDVLLVGDFYFNGYCLLIEFLECVQVLDKLCINFGNVGKGSKCDEQYVQLIEIVVKYDKLVCIGVNWGSFDQVLLVCVMDENVKCVEFKDVIVIMCEVMVILVLELVVQVVEFGFLLDKIILLCKVLGVQDLIVIYVDLVVQCDYLLYFGLIEVGMGFKGIVVLSVVMGVLLQ